MRRLLLTTLTALALMAPAAYADIPPDKPPSPDKKDSGCQTMPTPGPLLPAAAAAALMMLAAMRKR